MNETKQSVPCRESHGALRRLAAVVVASILACCVFDACALTEVVDGIEWTYTVSDGKATLGNGFTPAIVTSTSGAVTVPSTLGGCPVENLASFAFFGCDGITSVEIPSGVTSLGAAVFRECRGLTKVKIPESVTSIGDEAFRSCAVLTSVTIPSGVTQIGRFMFYGCYELGQVTIPQGVTDIGEKAFGYCRVLESVTIPSSVTKVDQSAFIYCQGLVTVHISDLSAWCRIAFAGNIANPLYYAHRLYLGDDEITELVLPNDLTSIGDYAFFACSNLTAVTIPPGITNVGALAFGDCAKLVAVTLSNGVQRIGAGAFSGCALKSVAIPTSVVEIERDAFYSRGLEAVHIEDLAAWCRIAFKGDRSNPVSISHHLFLNQAEVVDLVVPNGMTCIGDWTFHGLSTLRSVTIPSGVTNIGSSAFMECDNLMSVTLPATIVKIGDRAFDQCPNLCEVHVEDLAAWCAVDFVSVDANPLSLGHEMWLNGEKLADVRIPEGVTSIGRFAFYGFWAMDSVTIPASVTNIGANAFTDCRGLTSVAIPTGVTTIEWGTFASCVSLRSVTIPDGVTEIKDDAFMDCSALETVVIPGRVKRISNMAFYRCSGLRLLTLSDGLETIGNSAFSGCSALETVTIPASVTGIADSFCGCSLLETVQFEGDAPAVSGSCFHLTPLKVVIVSKRTSGWGESGVWLGVPVRYCEADDLTVRVIDVASWEESTLTIASGNIDGPMTWTSGKVYVVDGSLLVWKDGNLTIEPGAIVKFAQGSWLGITTGTCIGRGAIFTALEDDTVGGDTNGDGGATLPEIGSYAVAGSVADDASTEYRYVAPQEIPSRVSLSMTLRARRTYWVKTSVDIERGATFSIGPGCVVKMADGCSMSVLGELVAQGTRAEPVVFTSDKDDSWGGDTNGDGDKTVPQPGDWAKIAVSNGGTAHFEHTLVHYASRGTGTADAILVDDGTVVFSNSELAFGQMYAVGVESGHFYATNSVIRDFYCALRHWPNDPFVNCVFHGCNRLANNDGQTLRNCIVTGVTEAWDWSNGRGVAYDHCVLWNAPGAGLQTPPPGFVGANGNLWADPLLVDPDNGDFGIAADSPCVDAGDGRVAPPVDFYGRPRMNVRRAKGAGIPNADGLIPDIGIYEVEGSTTVPVADLAVLSVESPSAAVPGDELTVAYVVTNRGNAEAVGTIRDRLMLKGAEAAVGGAEVALVECAQSYLLEPGASATFSMRTTCPAAREGAWRVGVAVNAERDVFEQNLSDNVGWAAETTSIELPALAPGETSVSVGPGAAVGFLVAEGVRVLRVRANATSDVVIYGANGTVPQAAAGGVAAVTLGDGSWLLVLPERGEDEKAYVVIENAGSESVEAHVVAEAETLSLDDVAPNRVAAADGVSVTLTGTGLGQATSVTLGGRPATRVTKVNEAQLVATFDLSGLAAGPSAVEVRVDDASSSHPVEVCKTTVGPQLKASLELPSGIRDGRVYAASVVYANVGDEPMRLPFFKVVAGESTTTLSLSPDMTDSHGGVLVGGVSPIAPAGTLKPGDEARIPVYFTALDSYKLRLEVVTDDPLDGAYGEFGGVAGYLAAAERAATRLNLRGRRTYDGEAFYGQAYRELHELPHAAVSGRLLDEATREPLGSVELSIVSSNGVAGTLTTAADGYFQFDCLADGDYFFMPSADVLLSQSTTNDFSVVGQEDLNDVMVLASVGGRVSGVVCAADGLPVAGNGVTLCDGTGRQLKTTETGANGLYSFDGLLNRKYVVRCASTGGAYAAAATNVVIDAVTRAQRVDFTLIPGAVVRGTVRCEGVPVSAGTVLLQPEDGTMPVCVPCSTNGEYCADGVAAGRYDVRFVSPQAESEAQALVLAVGDDMTVDISCGKRPLFIPLRAFGFNKLETRFMFLDRNAMSNVVAWAWDFDDDGQVDSDQPDPAWTYTSVGTNTVVLKFRDADGVETVSRYPDCCVVMKEIETVLREGAVVFGKNEGTLKVVSEEDGQLVLTGDPASGSLAAGSAVLARKDDEWYLRRILAASHEGDTWTLTVEPGSLPDVYSQYGLAFCSDVTLQMEDEDEGEADSNREKQSVANAKVKSNRPGLIASGDTGASALLRTDDSSGGGGSGGGGSESGGSGDGGQGGNDNPGESAAKLTLGVSLEVSFPHDMTYEYVDIMWKGRRYERQALSGNYSVEAKSGVMLRGVVAKDGKKEFPLSVKIPTGVPGVTVTPVGELYWSAEGCIYGKATLESKYAGLAFSDGFTRENNGEKKEFSVVSSGSLDTGYSLDFGGYLDLRGGARVLAKVEVFGGVVEAAAGFDAYVDAKCEVSTKKATTAELGFGVNAMIKAAADKFCKALPKPEKLKEFLDYELSGEISYPLCYRPLIRWTGPEPDFEWSPNPAPLRGDIAFLDCSKPDRITRMKDFYTDIEESVAIREYRWELGPNVVSSFRNPSLWVDEKTPRNLPVALNVQGMLPIASKFLWARKQVPLGDNMDDEYRRLHSKTNNVMSGQTARSCDPNEMVGPDGAGPKRFVRPGEWMDYTVYFENKAGAWIADAQEVRVTSSLSPYLDWSTFELGEVAFNNQVDLGLAGCQNGASETALRGMARTVRSVASLDLSRGEATWYLRVVDPDAPLGWPTDGSGFLPSNDETHRGEGHVTYRVKVREDAPDNVRIDASASIVFDYNDPITTNPAWWNTVGQVKKIVVSIDGVEREIEVVEGEAFGELPDPGTPPENCMFDGWYTKPGGNGYRISSLATVEPEIEAIYAHWLPYVAEMDDIKYTSLAGAVRECPYNASEMNEITLLSDFEWKDGRTYEYLELTDPEVVEAIEKGRCGGNIVVYKYKYYLLEPPKGRALVCSNRDSDWAFFTGQKVAIDLNGHLSSNVWLQVDCAEAVIRDTGEMRTGAVELATAVDLSYGVLTLESGKLIEGPGYHDRATVLVCDDAGRFDFLGGEIVTRDGVPAVYVSNGCIRVGSDAVATNAGCNVVLDLDASLELVAPLTGRIGITTGHDIAGAVIGRNAEGFAGAENFYCDTDPTLRGRTTEDGRIVWYAESPEPEPPLVPVLFDPFAPGALNPKGVTYNGFLGEDSLGGTFTLVVKKPKKGSTVATATLTKIDPATGKKVKVTGTVDVATGVCGGDLAGLELNAQGVGGSLGGVPAQGAVDAAKAKDQDALAVMNGFNKQTYGLVFADAAGEEAYLTAVFSTKGKVKVAGSYRGAKVSGKAQMSVGDAVCAVPFVWSKKGVTVTFVLWFDKTTRSLLDVSGLGAGATLVDAGLAGGPAATYPFILDETAVRASVPDAIDETFLPISIAFNGKKFDAGKAAKVSYKKGDAKPTVDTSKGDNVTGLKLSYSKGVLKGSFTVYAISPAGKLVKNKFTVAGVLIDGVGYAVGTNKKLPAIPFVLAK